MTHPKIFPCLSVTVAALLWGNALLAQPSTLLGSSASSTPPKAHVHATASRSASSDVTATNQTNAHVHGTASQSTQSDVTASTQPNAHATNGAVLAPTGQRSGRVVTPEQEHAAAQLLDEYVRTAISDSPTLAALRAKQASAREQVQPSGALPDPMVGAMYQSVGPPWQPMAPMSMVQAEVSQVIPGVGKRQARRNAADAEASVRSHELEAARTQIASAVRQLFAQIYASDREEEAMESANALIDLMVGTITGQFAAGRSDQEALAKVSVERGKLLEQLTDIRTNREVLVARLNQLLARHDATKVPRIEALPPVAIETQQLTEQVLDHSPDLRVQRAAINAANRRRENAETETRPNFLFGLSGGATTNGEPVVTLRFGMELPIWRASKQDPMIRAARKDIEAAESEYKAMQLKLRGEI
ncbi:MAG: TolC family protein, partial [Myxococcales bacterium]